MNGTIRHWSSLTMISLSTVIALSACSPKTATNNNAADPGEQTKVPQAAINEPVELTFYYMYADWSTEKFMGLVGKHIQKQYPNVRFNFIQTGTGTTIEDTVAAKQNLDVIIASQGQLQKLADLGLLSDISDLVTTYKYDLNRIEPSPLETMRRIANGSIVGLPYKINALALYYNKDIFDKFGVPYLKDGMTWDEIYEKARLLTRTDAGVSYTGISFGSYGNLLTLNQYGHELVDPKTRKPTFEDNFWKPYVDSFTRFYQLGSGPNPDLLNGPKVKEAFTKNKTSAMWFATIGDFPRINEWDFNWDVAAYPTFKELPDVGPPPAPTYMLVSANSKHRSEAFLAVASMLSDETQTELVKQGDATSLKNKQVRDQFGTAYPYLKDKNVKALLPGKMAGPISWNKETIAVQSVFSKAFADVAQGTKDVNTALREAQEAGQKAIDALK
ncbi:extracellular solute-binding protein [Paenibacillus ginsengarvi]|nr:extracellular solute-binding protein [Paenibacillus ginsengarvi]